MSRPRGLGARRPEGGNAQGTAAERDEGLNRPIRDARDDTENAAVEEAASLSARLVFEVVRRGGEEELRRPTVSLVHSGLAAGILIAFQVLGQPSCAHLPDSDWRPPAERARYALGFLLVILGRMQLCTESTFTTALPFISQPGWRQAGRVARPWSIVLSASVVGAFWVILTFTWLIAVGTSPTSSPDRWKCPISSSPERGAALFGFFPPVLAGNMIGGTAVFSLPAWGQVREEVGRRWGLRRLPGPPRAPSPAPARAVARAR